MLFQNNTAEFVCAVLLSSLQWELGCEVNKAQPKKELQDQEFTIAMICLQCVLYSRLSTKHCLNLISITIHTVCSIIYLRRITNKCYFVLNSLLFLKSPLSKMFFHSLIPGLFSTSALLQEFFGFKKKGNQQQQMNSDYNTICNSTIITIYFII